MAAGSYQVVSEHSILGALEATRQKTMESRPENTKHRRRHHAPTRRSGRRGEILKKCEEILENLRSQVSDLAKSVKHKEEEDTELEGATSEREESEKEQNAIAGEGNSGEPVNVIAKLEETELNGAGQEPPPELPEPPDRSMFKAEEVTYHHLYDGGRYLTKTVYDKEGEETKSNDGSRSVVVVKRQGGDEESLATAMGGGAMVMVCDLGERVLSLDAEGDEHVGRVGRQAKEPGRVINPLGQAQDKVSGSDLIHLEKGVSTVITEKEKKWFGLGLPQKKVDLTFNPMGQAHNFIITPPIFTNSGGGFKGKRSAATKVELFSTITEMFSHAYQEHLSTTTRKHFSTDTNTVLGAVTTLTFLIDDSSLSLQDLEAMNMGIVLFDKYVESIEKMKTTLPDSQNYSIEVAKLSKLLVGVGGNYSNGSMQLTVISNMEKSPLVYKWDPGGFTRGGWDPSGTKRDKDSQESVTSSLEYHGNTTFQHHQLILECQQEAVLTNYYSGDSMSFKMFKNPIIRAVQFNDEVRWLKIAKEIENKRLLFSAGEILNGKQGIGVGINAARGNQGVYGGTGRGMYSNNLHIKGVLLQCHLVAKIRNHKPLLLYNTWKAWLGKFSNGLKHSKSNKRVKLENETNIPGIGAMLLEFVMGRTTKKINDVEAFKDLLHADRGVKKEPRKSDIDLEIGKIYLAQSPKAMMENCVEHLIGGSEFPRMQRWEALLKSWDPGEPEYSSGIIRTFRFKLWDPGGRLVTVCFWYLHLEDKVNFEGAGIDTNAINEGYIGNVPKDYERRKWRERNRWTTAAAESSNTRTQESN